MTCENCDTLRSQASDSEAAWTIAAGWKQECAWVLDACAKALEPHGPNGYDICRQIVERLSEQLAAGRLSTPVEPTDEDRAIAASVAAEAKRHQDLDYDYTDVARD